MEENLRLNFVIINMEISFLLARPRAPEEAVWRIIKERRNGEVKT